MSRADYYFMTNLHLMFDKNTLNLLSEREGSTLYGAYEQKVWVEKEHVKPEATDAVDEETSRINTLINMLYQLFKRFGGGGMSIERLKDILRGKVKQIKPRF